MNIFVGICVSFTLLTIANSVLTEMIGYDSIPISNNYLMLLWCSIGTITLFSHKLLSRWSPLTMIVIQYLIANGLVFMTIYISSFTSDLHPNAYRDGFRSFTIPYIIGAIIYYGYLYYEAQNQNSLLQEVKNRQPIVK
ncbi:MAG: hypothetical protein JEZ08_08220 [Clostridiales bacterium]|nr:hypothetical protein [Clostridiales bacterium]